MATRFEDEYKKLNKEQKEAVGSIDGPVMVVAGPGTGKTQILALRIANILQKTDIKGDGILCLTFTNSAVDAMRERLVRYIGEAGNTVNVFTFHSFGMKVIEEHFEILGFKKPPRLLDETESALFFDKILNENDWEYLRPRSDGTRYYKDLKSLISLLKRERISREDFEKSIEGEIQFLKTDEKSFSSRGANKGELKKEVEKEIEGLEKSKEIVKFLEVYEKEKQKRGMIDYDDVLENLVKIVEKYKDVRAEIQERYLYLLVDEHQDSSRVQNEFISAVWSKIEKPDIFVVGDDRQLIYGFSGASIDHFQGFKKTFPDAKLIPLLHNYRSTAVILDAAHALLKSVMTDEKLVSVARENHPIKLIEAETPEQEIISCALDIKLKIENGKLKINDVAILVPKNAQVRDALEILHKEGLPVSTFETLSLFDQKETAAFMRVLKIIDSLDAPALTHSFFDEFSLVEPLDAHRFFTSQNMREFSVENILTKTPSLFEGNTVDRWISKLSSWKKYSESHDVQSVILKISEELFEDNIKRPVSGKDIGATLLSLLEKRPDSTLRDFISYLTKLESYGETIQVLSDRKEGIKVLTMHSSKGLEFDYVWIAHMDEKSLTGGRRLGFSLPESIAARVEERDIDTVKRKLYVAITRAKRFCTLSYAAGSKKGRDQELAKIIAELSEEVFSGGKVKSESIMQASAEKRELTDLAKLVAETYKTRYISAWLLNNFFECPWKWYFQNLLQLPEDSSDVLEFGGKVHDAIDEVLKQGKAIVPEDKEVAKIVSAWITNRLPEIANERHNEQPISIQDKKFPHLKMYGRIDLIEKLDSKNLRVTDFKTGSFKRASEIEKLDEEGRLSTNLRQLAMYSFLLHGSPAWKSALVSESRLEFLEAKNPKEYFYDTVIGEDIIDLLRKDIADYDDLAKTGKWLERECHYNSYGKNTDCEYCQMARIYG